MIFSFDACFHAGWSDSNLFAALAPAEPLHSRTMIHTDHMLSDLYQGSCRLWQL
ncbi:hypothetical protein HETIRDRAFT_173127 [Heterobasidion irregulare TC 32-1]|uniref:Uncharacterized protein n=1 Tax=Heterobasidion irregulare (strain TC 32-1) TaxID=747525 RepID=W4K6L3_HETIT|nr:uncharacterized protein HETIRDRAFT_173127 [Heterobasidion irregulare TC 32-1]ETW81443.1 hypothetical protein HETIRDRAFT_173127 [Heterobasidion irregulare TC 32-1]